MKHGLISLIANIFCWERTESSLLSLNSYLFLLTMSNNHTTVSTYHIIIAADDSPISLKAINYAIDFCAKLSVPYQLNILYAIGLNPPGLSTFPFIGRLDRMNNLDIEEDAKKAINKLEEYLAKYQQTGSAKVIVRKDEKDAKYIIEEYVNNNPPDLLIMGSSNKESIQKLVLGSVSDYCLHQCKCPVTIIK
ncbi:hypothetical protein BDF20DRAFT_880652 [Mycotypha africana]|uniref:uncharacterized protein n=1 Tax=Mycotypha africana TaxID=64632 RepID=UPI0022FFD94A|nr:uncharacterized protein BDF20DRAFT_880652 [Mycotypha africana]KAI8975776.1 hypothetical protein BDF20DRAFT_880652 [Mycotypha africana]